jgi:hypothetical protein
MSADANRVDNGLQPTIPVQPGRGVFQDPNLLQTPGLKPVAPG